MSTCGIGVGPAAASVDTVRRGELAGSPPAGRDTPTGGTTTSTSRIAAMVAPGATTSRREVDASTQDAVPKRALSRPPRVICATSPVDPKVARTSVTESPPTKAARWVKRIVRGTTAPTCAESAESDATEKRLPTYGDDPTRAVGFTGASAQLEPMRTDSLLLGRPLAGREICGASPSGGIDTEVTRVPGMVCPEATISDRTCEALVHVAWEKKAWSSPPTVIKSPSEPPNPSSSMSMRSPATRSPPIAKVSAMRDATPALAGANPTLLLLKKPTAAVATNAIASGVGPAAAFVAILSAGESLRSAGRMIPADAGTVTVVGVSAATFAPRVMTSCLVASVQTPVENAAPPRAKPDASTPPKPGRVSVTSSPDARLLSSANTVVIAVAAPTFAGANVRADWVNFPPTYGEVTKDVGGFTGPALAFVPIVSCGAFEASPAAGSLRAGVVGTVRVTISFAATEKPSLIVSVIVFAVSSHAPFRNLLVLPPPRPMLVEPAARVNPGRCSVTVSPAAIGSLAANLMSMLTAAPATRGV